MKKNFTLHASCCLIVLVVLGIWLLEERDQARKTLVENLCNTARTVTGTLAGSIHSDIEDNRISTQRLEEVFNNVISTTNLNFIIIRQQEQVILEVGKIPEKTCPAFKEMSAPDILEGDCLRGQNFFYWRKMRLEDCNMRPCPQPCNEHEHAPVPATSNSSNEQMIHLSRCQQVIILGFSDTAYATSMRETDRKLALTFAFGVVAASAILTIWIKWVHHHRLKGELIKVKAQKEKLEELELAATGLAHETKNPLGIIRALAQRAAASKDPTKYQDALDAIIEASDTAAANLSEFISYARVREPTLQPVPLKEIAQRAEVLLNPEFEEKGVTLTTNVDKIVIVGDFDMLQKVLFNFLLNSLNATTEDDEVILSATRTNSFVTIRVSDTGKGIDPELLPEIFKPYVTESPNGHGLGLAIARRTCETLGWELDVDSEVGKGTTMTIHHIQEARTEHEPHSNRG